MENRIFEEVINTSIHAFGILLSFIGLFVLVYYSFLYGNGFHMISSLVYGTSLVLLYSASTLLHTNLSKSNNKKIFSILDYSAIYLLIAGTYTPFLLIALKGALGFKLMLAIWLIAFMGIIYQLFFNQKYEIFSTGTYVLMGWIIVFAVQPLLKVISFNGIILLILGGLFYTVGSIFFILDKRKRFNHAVWHILVLMGSISHYLAIFYYVMPLGQKLI